MEIFNEIWVLLVAALGGISMTSIITAVIIGCLKGAFNKIISLLINLGSKLAAATPS